MKIGRYTQKKNTISKNKKKTKKEIGRNQAKIFFSIKSFDRLPSLSLSSSSSFSWFDICHRT
mgnify:CR=1 FL=1